MKVLLIAPNVDGTDVGEAFVAFKWAEALATRAELTVLCFDRAGRPPVGRQLPHARVITTEEPAWARRHERLNAMLKPAWPVFANFVRRWVSHALANGDHFHIAHQLMPQAARYASPLCGFDIPYVIGPLGGSLDTPETFRSEAITAASFTKLRALDKMRFRYDPWLRASYSKAACILGVAPYVRDVLQDVPIRRFEAMLELGIDELAPPRGPVGTETGLRLLHVGRAVRTKGLRDAVRAISALRDLPVTLTSAGDGEELAVAEKEAERLGVSDRVRFLGRVSRSTVEDLYRSHDVFIFPSFREAAGGVLYEAMRNGLPVITAARGGPGFIIDETCGLRVDVTEPLRFAMDLSLCVRRLYEDRRLLQSLSDGARRKVQKEGLWSQKAMRLMTLYRDLVTENGRNVEARTLPSGAPG